MSRRLLPLLLATLVLAGCSSIRVERDFDPSVDFTGFQTFAWLPATAPPAGEPNDLLTQRIQRAVRGELVMKRMRPVEARADADLLIAHHVSVEQRFEVNTRSYGYGYGTWRGTGAVHAETTVSQYEEGTLVIDLIDSSSMNVVWRGTAQSRLSRTSTPEQREALVKKAVAAIFAEFPPGS